MNEDAQKDEKRREITKIFAPLFFIFGALILCFSFDFFDWKSNLTRFSKEFFLQKTVNVFALNELEINGNSQISNEKIEEILYHEIQCDKLLDNNIFLFSLPKIQAELHYLEWIENVKIARHFPDKISINIIEKKPLVKWKIDNNNTYLVEKNGLIFKKFEGEIMENIPIIKNSFGKIDFLVDIFKKNNTITVEIFEIEFRDFWHIKLMNDLILKISSNQMNDFIAVMNKLHNNYHIFDKDTDIGLLDFRNENKIYIKRKRK